MKEDDEFKIYDILYILIKEWRLLIVLALVFGILFGSYTVLKNRDRSYSAAEIHARAAALGVSNVEVKKLQTNIDKNQADIIAKQSNLDQSILMKIDPASQGSATLEVAIKLLDNNKNNEYENKIIIRNLISNYIQTGKSYELYDYVNKSVHSANQLFTNEDLSYLIEVNFTNQDTISIEAIYADKETALIMAEAVLAFFRNYSINELHINQPHDLVLINTTNSLVTDHGLTVVRQSLETAIEKLKTKVEEDQEIIKTIVLADLATNSKSNVLIRIAYGVMIGVIIGALYKLIRFIFNLRLRRAKEIQQKLGIYIIGSITSVK